MLKSKTLTDPRRGYAPLYKWACKRGDQPPQMGGVVDRVGRWGSITRGGGCLSVSMYVFTYFRMFIYRTPLLFTTIGVSNFPDETLTEA